MLLHTADRQIRMQTARRIFTLVPLLVFLLSLILLVSSAHDASHGFVQMLLRSTVASLASSLVCMAAFSFYRYLSERTTGL